MRSSSAFVGISFGPEATIAWFDPDAGRAETIRNSEGEFATPSTVYFGEAEPLVGRLVREAYEELTDPILRERLTEQTVAIDYHLLLGQRYFVTPGSLPVRFAEVLAKVLRKIKHDAEEEYFHEEVSQAVVAYPALLGRRAERHIVEAATMAGFTRVQTIDQPVAAVLAVEHSEREIGKGALIYRLGESALRLDVVVRIGDGSFVTAVESRFVDRCGGRDFDPAIYRHCDGVAREQLGWPISLNGGVDRQFLWTCKQRRENLLTQDRTRFATFLPTVSGDPMRFTHEIDRDTFEALIQERVEATVRVAYAMLEQSRERVDTLILLGDAARVPLVRRMVGEILGLDLLDCTGLQHAAAIGAAYRAHGPWAADPDSGAAGIARKSVVEGPHRRGLGFDEADAGYAELRRQSEAGKIGVGEFDVRPKQLMVQDSEGRWWAKSRNTGDRHRHDGRTWARADPSDARRQ